MSGCSNDLSEVVTYKINQPVFMDIDDFRNSVKVTSQAQHISRFRDVCIFENYIYLSEPQKGIHIIDNSNPSNPKNIGFIHIIGNSDISISNSTLYADSYIDLLSFDISNPSAPKLKERKMNVFPEAMPSARNEFGYDYTPCHNPENKYKIVIDWELNEISEEVKYYGESDYSNNIYDPASQNQFNIKQYQHFSIYNDLLYTVVKDTMRIFNLYTNENKLESKPINTIAIGWNAKAIFNYNMYLYANTPSGLIRYSLENPIYPQYIDRISDISGNYDLIIEDNFIFASIRKNQVEVTDSNSGKLVIMDLHNPKSPLATYQMKNPRGITLTKQYLFICDNGLKIYDRENLANIRLLATYNDINGYHIFMYAKYLMVITTDGLYQYDYSNIQDLKLVSKLATS